MEEQAYVKTTLVDAIGYVTFFHPSHNSLPGQVLSDLAESIRAAGENDAIKVVVLKSGGDRTFCAGASFNELVNINDETTGEKFFSGFANVINAMRKCPKFIIGRIQGKTVGGGVGLAAATDYCMASKFAAVKLSELNIGIGPFVVGPAIERKIGLSAMSQIAIDANSFYPATWALEKGLFTHVLESTEELDQAVKTFAAHLATYNPEAMAKMKRMFWQGTDDWDTLLAERAAISGSLVLSNFTKETLKRFQ